MALEWPPPGATSRPPPPSRPTLNFEGASRKKNLNLNIEPTTGTRLRALQTADTDSKFNQIMARTGKIHFNGSTYVTSIDDLESLGELGNGTCGHVVKMKHKTTGQIMAVKQMRRSGNPEENKRIIMDLEVVLKSHDCPFIVRCLGCFITHSDVWICMELMATCMDKLLKQVKEPLPENVIGKVSVATVKALHYLKEHHGVIHRDVKPSNILIDERGNVKLCDFGISGQLIDSKAQTRGAGCTGYMAPERINPPNPSNPVYDIRADVWSLGITLVELATGSYPYTHCANDFEVMTRILGDDPPTLPPSSLFSPAFRSFVNDCLIKNYAERPKYRQLLAHEFIIKSEANRLNMATWYEVVFAARKLPPSKSASSFQAIGRNSGRTMRSSGSVSSNRLGSTGTPTPSPITPSPGSGRLSPADIFIQSPGFSPNTHRLRSNFDRLNSDPVFALGRPAASPATPSPLHPLPPDPPPRLSRMGSDGLRTPTPTSSSGLGSSSSGGLLTSPSPTTSLSLANSSPSPEGPQAQPPTRRLRTMLLCYPGC